MKKAAKIIAVLFVLLLGAIGVRRAVDAASAWNRVIVDRVALEGEWDGEPEALVGFGLRGRRATADFELSYRMRVGGGPWQSIGVGGSEYRAYGVETVGKHRVVPSMSGEWALDENEDPDALKPKLVSRGGALDGPSRLSRMYLAEQHHVAWGALLMAEGVRERLSCVQSRTGLDLGIFFAGAEATSAVTSGPMVAWGEGLTWNGERPTALDLVESQDELVATWRVRLNGPTGAVEADLETTLSPLAGPIDDAEALERLWRP